ncbi:MAG: flagellar hook-associated protein FlgK [Gemmatimonadota bacterium]
MSITSFLSIARSALLTQQRAMNVTAQNIANAQTPGYSRQRMLLVAATPLLSGGHSFGRGVADGGIQRSRDSFYDATFRRETGLFSQSDTLLGVLTQVEAAVHEPSQDGLAASLDGLFNSFSELAADPTSPVARGAVVQAASSLVGQFHRLDSELTQATQDAGVKMTHDVGEANRLAQVIGKLNGQILAAGESGAPDLQDQRDVAIDQLSNLVAVRVLPRTDGSLSVQSGNTLLVDGAQVQSIGMTANPGGGFNLTAGGIAFDPQSGSLKALADTTTTILPGIRAQLNTLAQSLVTEVNAVHRTGFTASGATNVDFFDPAGVSAGNIQLSAAVAESSGEIAAGASSAPGDSAIALALGGLGRSPVGSLVGATMRDFYVDLAGTVGSSVSDAESNARSQQALTERADLYRSSISGVSVDEEMTSLIAQQQAYSAAARMVSIADQMIQEVLQMVG